MKCKCIKDYRDGNVDFKVNEVYEYITIPTSSQFPPVYKIYNGKLSQKTFSHAEFKTYYGKLRQKIFSHAEFKTYFRRAA